VHAQFARLTRNEPRLGLELRQFLAQAYDIKSIADYGLGPDTEVPLDRAGAAIDTAEQFVNRMNETSPARYSYFTHVGRLQNIGSK
jgi:uncharacterized protein (UPF0332 family)